ncbi:MAG: hypothetical protein IIC24_02090 [Chloroflexi bacterium]|nr:hypothetical protein [Chloroflexota bacterium]MCH8310219.1 hypothetical protein [Chloroflexota bacterium]
MLRSTQHGGIIDVFEELYRDDIEAYANSLAYHAAEAESIIGPDNWKSYCSWRKARPLARSLTN